MRKPGSSLWLAFATWLPLVALLLAWEVAGTNSKSITFFFATPGRIASTASQMLAEDKQTFTALLATGAWPTAPNGGLIWNTAITAFEAVCGFLIGNLVGASVGIGLWYNGLLARIAKPYLTALGALPVFAIAPITILWFGVGIEAKIWLAFLSTVFLAAAQAYRGAEEVDPLLVKRLKVFGASRWVTFRRLLLPSALVWIFSSLRLTIGAALLGAFVGEFIASDQGIGRVILRASGIYDTSRVLVGVAAIILVAVSLDALVRVMEKTHFRFRFGGRKTR